MRQVLVVKARSKSAEAAAAAGRHGRR